MTPKAKEQLSDGVENVFCETDGITCFTHVRGRSAVSLLQSRAMSTIVIVMVVSGSPEKIATLPNPAASSPSLKGYFLTSLQEAATDPDLLAALESATVEEITSVEGPAWIEGKNAENAPINCLTADGTYADHLHPDHTGGPGDIWYGDLTEAKTRCDANDECVVLHDWNGDGKGWRACKSVTYNDEGPAHTMVRAI
jgi:hypothetical protein